MLAKIQKYYGIINKSHGKSLPIHSNLVSLRFVTEKKLC